ncbi:hypothetical protein LXL04_033979 [Taraxacum kok-saghyz]
MFMSITGSSICIRNSRIAIGFDEETIMYFFLKIMLKFMTQNVSRKALHFAIHTCICYIIICSYGSNTQDRVNQGEDTHRNEVLVAGKTSRSVTEAVGKKAHDSNNGDRLKSGCSGREITPAEGKEWTDSRSPET